MKLTKDLLRQLILEALEDSNVIQGKFGGGPAADQGKEASVTDIASKFKKEPEMLEGTEWMKDLAQLIDMVMSEEVYFKLGEIDEPMAEKMIGLAEKIFPIVQPSIAAMKREKEKQDNQPPDDLEEAEKQEEPDPSQEAWKEMHGEKGSDYIGRDPKTGKKKKYPNPWPPKIARDQGPED